MSGGVSIFEVLREQVSLEEVASRYTELKRSGRSLKGRCPYPDHDDGNPSFHIYPDGRFCCYGCRRHGDVTDLWADVRGRAGQGGKESRDEDVTDLWADVRGMAVIEPVAHALHDEA